MFVKLSLGVECSVIDQDKLLAYAHFVTALSSEHRYFWACKISVLDQQLALVSQLCLSTCNVCVLNGKHSCQILHQMMHCIGVLKKCL